MWVRESGKQAYLGGYASEEEAAEAHDVAALKCHGLKAKTNFHLSRHALATPMTLGYSSGGNGMLGWPCLPAAEPAALRSLALRAR